MFALENISLIVKLLEEGWYTTMPVLNFTAMSLKLVNNQLPDILQH